MASGRAKNVTEQAPLEKALSFPNIQRRVTLKNAVGLSDGGISLVGQRLVVGGWVKSSREIKREPLQTIDNVVAPKVVSCAEVLHSRIPFFKSIIKVFGGGDHHIRNKLTAVVQRQPQLCTSILQISDGSCIPNLQVLVDSELVPPCQVMPSGVCILVEGILQQQSGQGKQGIELKAEKILHLGTVEPNKYPLSKKRVPLEMLRDSSAHFRPRTKTVASVMRIRNALSQSTHTFFQKNGFIEVQVPIITTTDTEGYSKKFQVTTLLETEHEVDKTQRVTLRNLMDSVEEKSKKVEELQRTASNKEAFKAATEDLQQTTEMATQLERTRKRRSPETTIEAPKLNFSDYFSQKTFLTVSGRLHLESYASALGNVYSFGPRFCAEKTDSMKSMPEMWMVELEMAFSQLEDAMECADSLLKFMCSSVLNNSTEDIKFLSKRTDKTLLDRLQQVTMSPSEKISYTHVVDILKKVTRKKFQEQVQWGNSLTEEHESYLVDVLYKRPVIIYNHPKQIRPFYARLNNDGKTVASFDVVVPKIGTLLKGSQNEERLATLNGRMEEAGLRGKEYEWCKDLRRHGTVKHAGFSLAFDRLVLYATGLNDVRDSIPFPRSCGKVYN